MSKYTEFKELFDITYPDINDFMWDVEDEPEHNITFFEYIVKDYKEEPLYDDRDNNFLLITVVLFFPHYDCYVKFSGEDITYGDRTWDEMREVQSKIKTIEIFE